ncbi:hypothetical protein [Methylobacterium nodulans]|uniref:hypothetical protein n=1 Tax=Methylobacterium nodulans TaxID=114616 RepID=UPI0002F59200|nr:hypothetical protein [Methylobacterium nodulans]
MIRPAPQMIGPLRVARIGNRFLLAIPEAGPAATVLLTPEQDLALERWLGQRPGDVAAPARSGPPGLRLVRGLSADGDRPVYEKAGDALSGGTSPAPAQRLHSSSRGEA